MSGCDSVNQGTPEQRASLEVASKNNHRVAEKCLKVFLAVLSFAIFVLSVLAAQGRIDGALCGAWVAGLSAPVVLGALFSNCIRKKPPTPSPMLRSFQIGISSDLI